MAKKTIINSILMKNAPYDFTAVYFTVGGIPLKKDGTQCTDQNGNPLFPPVESIKHCRDRFGQGTAVNIPCYVIHFEDNPQRIIIPADQCSQVGILVIDENENNDVPALPEDSE
jgi:hypothetical protein